MKRSRFSEEQIIGILKEHQAGLSAAQLCRKHGLNEHLFQSLRHARHLIAAWRDDHTHHRPHTSLDALTPREFRHRSSEDQTPNRLNC